VLTEEAVLRTHVGTGCGIISPGVVQTLGSAALVSEVIRQGTVACITLTWWRIGKLSSPFLATFGWCPGCCVPCFFTSVMGQVPSVVYTTT
jgi:hypothetical protein